MPGFRGSLGVHLNNGANIKCCGFTGFMYTNLLIFFFYYLQIMLDLCFDLFTFFSSFFLVLFSPPPPPYYTFEKCNSGDARGQLCYSETTKTECVISLLIGSEYGWKEEEKKTGFICTIKGPVTPVCELGGKGKLHAADFKGSFVTWSMKNCKNLFENCMYAIKQASWGNYTVWELWRLKPFSVWRYVSYI